MVYKIVLFFLLIQLSSKILLNFHSYHWNLFIGQFYLKKNSPYAAGIRKSLIENVVNPIEEVLLNTAQMICSLRPKMKWDGKRNRCVTIPIEIMNRMFHDFENFESSYQHTTQKTTTPYNIEDYKDAYAEN